MAALNTGAVEPSDSMSASTVRVLPFLDPTPEDWALPVASRSTDFDVGVGQPTGTDLVAVPEDAGWMVTVKLGDPLGEATVPEEHLPAASSART